MQAAISKEEIQLQSVVSWRASIEMLMKYGFKETACHSIQTLSKTTEKAIQVYFHQPNEMKKQLLDILAHYVEDIIIAGPFESRFIVFFSRNQKHSHPIILSLSMKLVAHPFLKQYFQGVTLSPWLGIGRIKEETLYHLAYPKVKLVALYHPENFPLPRFSLSISDIARAIREAYQGQVSLCDMQLGQTVDEIVVNLQEDKPEIVGISATFGQQDVLEALMVRLTTIPNYTPLIVLGGSLSVLNYERLLKLYPNVIIGMHAGEATMQQVIAYWHQQCTLEEVSGIAYCTPEGDIHKNGKVRKAPQETGIPELDLLEDTLCKRGVMQLESTRGCSYACSFCPRAHKGVWQAQPLQALENLLPEISHIYDQHPEISRKIFLVDEEFVGYKEENSTVDRILSLSQRFKQYRFRFETSARVDQIYRHRRDRTWHIQRLGLWRTLVENGLDRVLFGVESGVASVLKRFNKKTTVEQNTYAIRLVSTLNIPVRLTYITFDPLMSMEELIETYRFQGRTDLFLQPNHQASIATIYDSVHDEAYVQSQRGRHPLYQHISYMLVSIECLIGSKYLKLVEAEGLAREYHFSMGKRQAVYLDSRIGLMSHHSQLWIDRNFALDYLLKSLEKISQASTRARIRALRNVLKDYAYALLGQFLAVVLGDVSLLATGWQDQIDAFPAWRQQWETAELSGDELDKAQLFKAMMTEHFIHLSNTFQKHYDGISATLSAEMQEKTQQQINTWKQPREWKLINSD